jgi:hypothetical protein
MKHQMAALADYMEKGMSNGTAQPCTNHGR